MDDPSDSYKQIPESILKRNAERQQLIDKRKEEKLEIGGTQQQINYFMETFSKKRTEINDALSSIENGDVEKQNFADLLDKLSKELQILNRFLTTATVYLRVYDIRKCKQLLDDTQLRLQQVEEKSLPKKKFGFKSKKHQKTLDKESEIMKCDVVDGELKRPEWWKTDNCSPGFTGRRKESLNMSENELAGKDVVISDIEDCTITLLGSPSTLHVTGLKGGRVLCGPVATSVFVENCSDCTLVFACQQLRVHSTQNARFYLHVTSRAIIEDAVGIGVAPFNLSYDGLDAHFKQAGLDRARNNWDAVDDFNWLASDSPSPNWAVIADNDRVIDWNLESSM
ncbi:tubulin-specific chaperone C [Nilaparvata lugens]|uniref:tubulin-specific chaperone C n=1 Tax=Nilaparvata lugens TaxID=108931 RepID=UPI00193DE254|nr:tubulin-specific chaperone C [Nilaparvata lugens]